jgi:hypothetical protein
MDQVEALAEVAKTFDTAKTAREGASQAEIEQLRPVG